MKFTALDGREVDVSQVARKVVLIDFWATWCGPLPRGAAQREKRLMRPTTTRDSKSSASRSTAKANRQKFIDFTAKNGMPWPQHFDGKYWSNEFPLANTTSPASLRPCSLDQTGPGGVQPMHEDQSSKPRSTPAETVAV